MGSDVAVHVNEMACSVGSVVAVYAKEMVCQVGVGVCVCGGGGGDLKALFLSNALYFSEKWVAETAPAPPFPSPPALL